MLAEMAKNGDLDAMVQIVEACWRDKPHLTAKQVVARIRNVSHGQLPFELIRDGVLKYLGKLPENPKVGVLLDDPTKDLRKEIGEALARGDKLLLRQPPGGETTEDGQ